MLINKLVDSRAGPRDEGKQPICGRGRRGGGWGVNIYVLFTVMTLFNLSSSKTFKFPLPRAWATDKFPWVVLGLGGDVKA